MTTPLGGLGFGGILAANDPLRGEVGGDGTDWSRGEGGTPVFGCADWSRGDAGTGGGPRGEETVRATALDGADLLRLM